MPQKQIKPKPEPHPYTRLPFVFDPSNKRGEPCRQRDFWHVSPNGNYDQECRLGDAFARELLGFMRDQNEWGIARYVLVGVALSHGSKPNGIEVGFLSVICQLLLHGLTAGKPPELPAPTSIIVRQYEARVAAERAAKRTALAAVKRALKAGNSACAADPAGRT